MTNPLATPDETPDWSDDDLEGVQAHSYEVDPETVPAQPVEEAEEGSE